MKVRVPKDGVKGDTCCDFETLFNRRKQNSDRKTGT